MKKSIARIKKVLNKFFSKTDAMLPLPFALSLADRVKTKFCSLSVNWTTSVDDREGAPISQDTYTYKKD